ncbi:hypothetical protein VYU27_005436 [Nannochloropsis oceanica]
MNSPERCRRRLFSSILLLFLELIFPKPTTSFLPAPLHSRNSCSTLYQSVSPNQQNDRSEASAPTSLWQRLFQSTPRRSREYEEELEAVATQVKYLEQQHRSELASFRQKLEEQWQEQQSNKWKALPYAGTWTVELTGGNYVHCTPIFNLGGLWFRLVLTEKIAQNCKGPIRGKYSPRVEAREGEGGRPVGVFVEYLPSSSTGEGGAAATAVPCLRCRFELLNDLKENCQIEKEEGELAECESEPTFLNAAGGALGVPHFTDVCDHPPPPLPLPLSRFQQLQQPEGQEQQPSKVLVGFEISLCAVKFLSVTEQAQAMREAWVRTEAAVEEQVRAVLVKEEESRVTAELHVREAGEWRERVDMRFFDEGGSGRRGGGKSGEEEKLFVEDDSDEESDDDDENRK